MYIIGFYRCITVNHGYRISCVYLIKDIIGVFW